MTEKVEAKAKASEEQLKVNEKKWSRTLMKTGWTVLPNIIIEKQAALGLTTTDVCILLHLAKHWWKAGESPWPAKKTIAQAIGKDPRTVQRRIEAMEKLGLIRREERRTAQGSKTNLYHLDGLIAKAKPFANEALREKERRRAAEEARLRRKTPLQVVK